MRTREDQQDGPDPARPAGEPGDSPLAAGAGESVEILPMGQEDLPEVVALELVCFSDPWSLLSFRAELKADPVSWCRVLRIDGRLGGYMVCWFVEDEAHLANLAVAPWCRRQGLARRMLGTLLDEAYLRGCRMIVLEVRSSNAGAMELYLRNGFVAGGVRRNYYNRPREDAILMVRSLRVEDSNQ